MLRKMRFMAVALVLALSIAAEASAQPWSFGVMGDTQWTLTTDPAGQNPNAVAVSFINQINQQFIKKGVKFVIAVGDLTENGNDADEIVRANAAQTLYSAGIGFFPMRGNHETYASPANNYAIPIFQTNYPQTRGISNTFGAANFSSPTSVSADLNGMTYSFDFGTSNDNARFVILDTWVTPSKKVTTVGYDYGYSIADQQAWISSRLDKSSRGTTHAFVFTHQPLIAENHQDSPFVGYTIANPEMQDAFFAGLQSNSVKYYISGHDHIHQRSIITSPDGASKVQELIAASLSSKFYTPKALTDSNWFGQKSRELPIRQELYTPGFYIYTVDGPRVTVDYYSDITGGYKSDASFPGTAGSTVGVTPTFNFVKKETWGYSLNGQEFLVAQGESYTKVSDSIAAGSGFVGTTAKILSGANGSSAKDYTGRTMTKAVDTGWSAKTADTASDILSLWGMASYVGSDVTDIYTLSLSFDPASVTSAQLSSGSFGLVTKDSKSNWVNAAGMNFGDYKRFVFGPWDASYGLGTYGVDTASKTAWTVVNYAGDFTVAAFKAPYDAKCASTFSTSGALHIPVIDLGSSNGPLYWADLQYSPSTDGFFWFKAINAGTK